MKYFFVQREYSKKLIDNWTPMTIKRDGRNYPKTL